MNVVKFGGGCLKNGEDFIKVAEIITKKRDKTIVVVSAVQGVTDLLLAGLKEVMETENNLSGLMEALMERHRKIARETIPDEVSRQKAFKDIGRRLKRLERLLFGVAYTKEASGSLKAQILSYGERLSSNLLAWVLKAREIEAFSLEADEIGIVTDECFENATADLEEVKKRLRRTLLPIVHQGKLPVITGYFGCTPEGKVTTFGRNGTDYSAAVIAYAVDASRVEIWKDVDGFMTADPKIVNRARRIDRLSYYEAAELSYFGAKILHPRAVEPLIERRIPVFIRNIYNQENKGTEILNQSYEGEKIIKSVANNMEIVVLRIHGPGVGFKPGIIAEVGQRLSEMGINIFSILTSQTCINLLLDKKDAHLAYQSILKMEGGVIEKVNLEEDIALISVVGEGLKKRKGVAAGVFSAVAREDINVEMISSGASEVAYYFIVKEKDVEQAVKAVHSEFFL
ncbi:MAG: aspartate kinase [Acidobacteriota bacterium]